MASTISTTLRYQQRVAVKQVTEPSKAVVTFVPTLVDIETSIRNVINALQWRRQLLDFVAGFVSGAVSLR